MIVKSTPRTRPSALVAVSAILFALGLSASAASLAAENGTPLNVIVEAARATTKVVGRSDIGAPIEQMSLRAHVRYSDLDLATSSGAATLKSRVSDAARLTCRDLDKMYPLSDADPQCALRTADDAMPQVKAAIARAESKARAKQ